MKNRLKIMSNKTIAILTILTLLIYIIINFLNINVTYAKHVSESKQPREEYNSSKIDKYPGYKELIEKIKIQHPNWKIKIHYTNLDWKTVLQNETTGAHTRNLVPKESISSWICPECGSKPQDSGSWVCASEAIVAYFMDPRNWINDDYMFQFENLSFNESIQTVDGVQKITSRIGYMQGNTVTYTTTTGAKATINKSYAQIIYEAAKEAGISPYHLASRIKQEQGVGSSPSGTATGTYTAEYIGYYNFLNIGATGGNGNPDLTVRNGLKKAKDSGWTSPEKSIKAGAKELASGYINNGQDTLYLQKFDVDDNGSLFYHQYMQNLQAAKSESTNMRSTYADLGFIDNTIEFLIPVFENMPSVPCTMPGTEHIVTQNAQIKAGHTGIKVRESASTSSRILREINSGEKFLRIQIGTQNIDKYYWDKIVLSDGTKGYIANDFIEQINDIVTCNETVTVTGSDVRLRNGPGTSGTTVKEYLNKGQTLTRIEKNKYNLDGLYWDRVITSSGLQGYVASNYLKLKDGTNNNFKISENDLICEPFTTAENVKEKHANAIIKDTNNKEISTGNIGTGYKVIIADKTYTIVKLGDINGDGKVSTIDYMKVKNHIMEIDILKDTNLKAADTSKDNKISTLDYMMIKNQIMFISNIQL